MTSVTYPKLVLFDWDGTIVSSALSILNAHNHVRINLGLELWDMLTFIEKAARIGTAKETFSVLYPDDVERAHQLYYEHIADNRFETLEIIAGVIEFIELLKKKEILLGVVSNMRHDALIREIDAMGLSNYFNVVVGAGEAARGKPHPDPIYLAVERLGLPHSMLGHTWFFGDMETDEKSSKAAGCQFFYYMGGISDDKERSRMEAHMKFDSYNVMANYFLSLTH